MLSVWVVEAPESDCFSFLFCFLFFFWSGWFACLADFFHRGACDTHPHLFFCYSFFPSQDFVYLIESKMKLFNFLKNMFWKWFSKNFCSNFFFCYLWTIILYLLGSFNELVQNICTQIWKLQKNLEKIINIWKFYVIP